MTLTDSPCDVPRLPLVPPVDYDSEGYPCGDGECMESHRQFRQVHYAVGALTEHYRHRSDVFVTGNVFINYIKGDRTAAVGPDTFVAFGARPIRDRLSYKLWEDPAPVFVMEVLSKKTKDRDMTVKYRIYEWMGVSEYWLYDVDGRWIPEHFAPYRLTLNGKYEPISPVTRGIYRSDSLSLEVRHDNGTVRFHDPSTGLDLPTIAEITDARAAAEERAAKAEAALAALKAQLRDRAP